MELTLTIPDDLAAQITASGKDPALSALEAVAVDGYRSARLTENEVRIMLGYETRMQVHTLLAEHNVDLQYTEEQLRQDIAASDLSQAQRDELDNRLATLDKDSREGITWAALKSELEQRCP